MKKILVLLVICFLAFPVWAAKTAALTSELEASASALFGAELGNDGSAIKTGIETNAEFTFTLALVETSTEELGEGDFYGWIEVKDFEIQLEAGDGYPKTMDLQANKVLKLDGVGEANAGIAFDWGEINAKLVMGDLYINLIGNEGEVDLASNSLFTITGASVTSTDKGNGRKPLTDINNVIGKTGMGFGVGYNFMDGDATVELGFASGTQNKWYEANNEYLISLYFSMSNLFDALGVKVVANQWLNTERAERDPAVVDVGEDSELMGATTAGLSVDYSYPITDSIILKPAVGVDMMMSKKSYASDDSALDLQFGGAVSLIWPSLGLDEDDKELEFFSDDAEVTSGVSIGANYSMVKEFDAAAAGYETANYMDIVLAFYEDSGDAGLVPGLGAQLLANYTTESVPAEVTEDGTEIDASHMGLGLYLDYTLATYYVPFAGVIYQMYDMSGDDTASNMELTLGIKLVELIPNTTLTLNYSSGNLLGGSWDAVTGDDGDLNKYITARGGAAAAATSRDYFNAENFAKNTPYNMGRVTLEAEVSF